MLLPYTGVVAFFQSPWLFQPAETRACALNMWARTKFGNVIMLITWEGQVEVSTWLLACGGGKLLAG